MNSPRSCVSPSEDDYFVTTVYIISLTSIESLYDRPVDPRVTVAHVEGNRGISSVQELGEWLLHTYPSLTTLYVEQNFGGTREDDEWKTWGRLYKELDLKVMVITDEQTQHKSCPQFTPLSQEDVEPDGYVAFCSNSDISLYEFYGVSPEWIGSQCPFDESFPGRSENPGENLKWLLNEKDNHVLRVSPSGDLVEIVWETKRARSYRKRRKAWEKLRRDPVWQAEQRRIGEERRREEMEKETMRKEERASALAQGRPWLDISYVYLSPDERVRFSQSSFHCIIPY